MIVIDKYAEYAVKTSGNVVEICKIVIYEWKGRMILENLNKYVLAMYDVRGKQDFIFRSKHIKEIIGASAMISEIFEDYLYEAAIEYRNQCCDMGNSEALIRSNDREFTRKDFCDSMEKTKQYVGQVVYDGGGNFFVLYKNKEIYRQINKIFSKKVLEETYSLKVISAYIEGVDFHDFKGDRKKLYEIHRKIEAVETPCVPALVLPFTQVDYATSMPLYKTKKIAGEEKKLTRESYQKYKKFEEIRKRGETEDVLDEKILDNLVTEKGRESLLAIIYIDGNNMGAKVKDCLEKVSNYEDCVRELRKLSSDIQRIFIDERKKAIDEALKKKYNDQGKRRFVVQAGDEINFICNARDAYTIVKEYFRDLPEEYSACAGISIFHSHTPYSEAYRIAEECCESGKKKMKRLGLQEANLIDMQYCQAGIGIDLETIRKREVGDLISKPWFVKKYDVENMDEDCFTLDMVEKLADQLNKMARSNVKALAEYIRKDLTTLKMELKRIDAHSDKEKNVNLNLEDEYGNTLLDDEKMQKLLYDVVILYDLWFREEGNKNG